MAIGTLPPWLRGPDTTGELSSGASAGAAAAGLEQRARFESERMGMEAQRLRQTTALEQARLQQAAEQHQMEFQARQKLIQQDRLREDQRFNILNAYRTAALGIQKGRLEEAQTVANEKARNAALQFQREQAFARDVASGTPVMEAYRRNPVGAATLNAVQRTQIKQGEADKPLLREGKFPLLLVNPKTGETKQVYTPEASTGKMSEMQKENLKDLRHERDQLEKNAPLRKSEIPAYEQKLRDINNRIESLKAPTAASEKSSSKDKVVRAHALGIAHPDWTKEQIIDAVNKEMP